MKITASVLGILSLLIPRPCVREDDKIIREEGRIFSKVSTIFEARIVMNIERKTVLVKDDSFFVLDKRTTFVLHGRVHAHE